MTICIRSTIIALSACTMLTATAAYADHDRREFEPSSLILDIASAIFVAEVVDEIVDDRRELSRYDRAHRRASAKSFDRGRVNAGRGHGYGGARRHDIADSYTSEPIRGGSSRRTRIIENPYPNRPLRGISLTGIEHDIVHINDVITYPRKRLISHQGYSLSLHHPSRFLNTRGYVDYISVKAKRKEYFTVTFHYN